MDELLPIFLALISGIGLGVFYFGGLWWLILVALGNIFYFIQRTRGEA